MCKANRFIDAYIRPSNLEDMKFLATISIIALPLLGMAQSISPQVIASAGEHFANGSAQLSWTLGEVMIDTYADGNNILTQGFHQTLLTVTSIEENLADLVLNMYPNPTSELLNIDLRNNDEDLELQLFDMGGKLIHTDAITAHTGQYVLQMNKVESGKYLIRLQSADGQVNSTHQVVKTAIGK